ncbi:hypothetical protein [Xylophilus sp. GOD-11R]|uniref:hypothetical protein n=1 Tax=Xylophilus sp. GOD-11R TaxID=3089814 RepID=UPI00298C2C8C|nr:hypothetical protein [Xylophilus sp. GOD-11R]WPB55958.1 hypothetical protein R9X41_17660 [Xylophilus sp. GOD-11R]
MIKGFSMNKRACGFTIVLLGAAAPSAHAANLPAANEVRIAAPAPIRSFDGPVDVSRGGRRQLIEDGSASAPVGDFDLRVVSLKDYFSARGTARLSNNSISSSNNLEENMADVYRLSSARLTGLNPGDYSSAGDGVVLQPRGRADAQSDAEIFGLVSAMPDADTLALLVGGLGLIAGVARRFRPWTDTRAP